MSDYFQKGIVLGAGLVGAAAGLLIVISTTSEMTVPPVAAVQRGFRGTGMDLLYSPARLAALKAQAKIPLILPPASPEGVKASKAYKNVRVLGDLSVGQFTRLMVSMTTWVAPKQGCAYCHNVGNMADDENYTKVVARRMLQMTQNINGNWQSHVAKTGVTCWTCHAGNPVPKNIWFTNPGPQEAGGLLETHQGLAHPSPVAGSSALPYDPLTPYLKDATQIRVQSTTALPTDNRSTIKETEWTYALMMMFSQSLGVNCTYCHNTRSFSNWAESSPARVNAWYGIRMVRDLNNNYLGSLQDVFPVYRKGPTGDVPKVYCATCHQGIYKPLFGVSMIGKFPELKGPPATTKALLEPYTPAATPPAPAQPAPEGSPPSPAPAQPAPGEAAPPSPAPAPTPPAPPAQPQPQ